MVLHPRTAVRQAPCRLPSGLALWLGLCGALVLAATPARARPDGGRSLVAADPPPAQVAPIPATGAAATPDPFDDEPGAEITDPVDEAIDPAAAPASAPATPPAATAPAQPRPPLPADSPVPADAAVPLEIELTANQQGYDSQLQRFVATGSVMARFAGGRLLADRLEYEASTRTLYAVGNVRFRRGQQYLQASRLRYALLEGVGEIHDVYGVIDLDSTAEDLDLEKEASQPLPPPEPISCPPDLPPPPEWHPYPWAFTAWGGQMFHSDFGQTFLGQGVFRPEYVAGLGVQRRIAQAGPFSLELDFNWQNHWASPQKGGRYTGPLTTSQVRNLSTDGQYFSEFTGGLMLRVWLQPWLNLGFEEGVSVLTDLSNYESTYRRKSSRFLNYLAFEIEVLVAPEWSLVGRIHHRSGAFGTFNGVTEGSNAYLLGLRYRTGSSSTALTTPELPPPQGCPGAPPPGSEPPEGLAQQLEQVTMGPDKTPPPPRAADTTGQAARSGGSVWSRARAQERARREAISRIDQRVGNVAFQQSLTAERRYGFPNSLDTSTATNDFGSVRPEQLRDLTTKDNRDLVTGTISRWRFQAGKLRLSPNTLEGDRVGFTNDPFTPAQSWLDSEDVVITLMPSGDTVVKADRNLLRLEDRLPIPVTRETRFEKEEEVTNRFVLGNDTEDRDGFFVGYNVPIRLGQKWRLDLQPQVMIQRLFNGTTDAYPLPGSPAGTTSTVEQTAKTGDYFGLEANLTGPLLGFRANANLSLSTLDPDNIADGTRSYGDFARLVTMPLLGESTFRIYGAYRFRTWNGSLGEQDVYSAYGVSLEQQSNLPNWGKLSRSVYWRMGVGNFTANRSGNADLLSVWRANAVGSMNFSYPLWTGEPSTSPLPLALANTPTLITPGLRLNANVLGVAAYFSDGTNQNTLEFSGGPTLTLGHFEKPFLDYTQISVTGGITLRQGQSPLNFDRAVDLGTLGIGLAQQLVGPLVFSGGIGLNVDPSSEFYGEVTGSYLELRWQRRAYEIGVYYSPYDGLGGIRVRLNDFNFTGPGTPFIPYHSTGNALKRPF